MFTNYSGTVIKGSPSLQTSVANAEIVSASIRNFAFMNDQACTVIINGGDNIYLRAEQGLFIPVCNSFKITTNGITFNWVGVLA